MRQWVGWVFVASLLPTTARATGGEAFSGYASEATGMAPSFDEHTEIQAPKTLAQDVLGSVSTAGDVSWSHTIESLPALIPASITLSYSSSGPAVSDVAHAWTISSGLRIAEIAPAARVGAYANVDEAIVSVSGNGLSGHLQSTNTSETVPLAFASNGAPITTFPYEVSGTRYEYRGSGGFAVAWFVSEQNAWVVRQGNLSTLMRPAGMDWTGSSATFATQMTGFCDVTEPLNDDEPCVQATAWVPVVQFDTAGNDVAWDWSFGRLEAVWAGGRRGVGTAQAPTSWLDLIYENVSPDQIAVRFDEGVERWYDKRLKEVQVRETHTNYDLYQTHRLTYAEVDGRRELANIKITAYDDTERTIAAFTYQRWMGEMSAPVTVSDRVPRTSTFGSSTNSLTRTSGLLSDVNGDGLVDSAFVVRAPIQTCGSLQGSSVRSRMQLSNGTFSDGSTSLAVQCDSPALPLFYMAAVASVHGGGAASAGSQVEQTIGMSSGGSEVPASRTYVRRNTMDINGDGYLDLVETAAAPDQTERVANEISMWDAWDRENGLGFAGRIIHPMPSPLSGAPPVRGFIWEVRLGAVDGTMGAPFDIVAPFPFPGVRAAGAFGCDLDILADILDDAGSSSPIEDHSDRSNMPHVVQLRDVNADRIPDLLYFPNSDGFKMGVTDLPGAPQVFYGLGPKEYDAAQYVPARSFSHPVALAPADSDLADAFNSNDWVRPVILGEWLEMYRGRMAQNSTLPWHTTCQRAHTDTMRDFVDLNADGYVDFVVAADQDSEWSVFFGTPSGFSGTSIAWPVPDYEPLSRTESPRARVAAGLPEIFVEADPMLDEHQLNIVQGEGMYGSLIGNDEGTLSQGGTPPTPQDEWLYSNHSGGLAVTTIGLVDVDGDGLVDLVHSGGVNHELLDEVHQYERFYRYELLESLQWHRNVGGGFSPSDVCSDREGILGGPNCPEFDWLGHGVRAGVIDSYSNLSFPYDEDNDNVDDGVGVAVTYSSDRHQVLDLDSDGVLDIVSAVGDGEVEAIYAVYGTSPKGGLLLQVDNGGGGQTKYAYTQGARVEPAGTENASIFGAQTGWLVDRVLSRDGVTGHVARRVYTYEDPVCGLGACPGFAFVATEQQEAWTSLSGVGFDTNQGAADEWQDPESVDLDHVAWRTLSRSETDYNVHRDGTLPVYTEVSIDASNAGVPNRGALQGQADLVTVWTMEAGYTHVGTGDASCANDSFDSETIAMCRLNVALATSYGLDPSDEGTPTFKAFEWTDEGLFAGAVIEQGGANATAGTLFEVEVGYVADEFETSFVPSTVERREVGSSSQEQVVARTDYAYDGGGATIHQGRLTTQASCGSARPAVGTASSPCGAGADDMVWTFSWTDRGALQTVDGPVGSYKNVLGWWAGEAMPTATENALGHVDEAAFDAFGRSMWTMDPNGVVEFTDVDGLDRLVTTRRCGLLGASGYECGTTAVHTYSEDLDIPAWSRVDSGFGESTASFVIDTTAVSYLNGFGRERQSWNSHPAGLWVVDSFYDLFGQLRQTTRPHLETSLPSNLAGLAVATGSEVGLETWYTGLGDVALSWHDKTADPDCMTWTWRPQGSTLITVDESGRTKALESDAAGRLRRVLEDGPGGATSPSSLNEDCVSPQATVTQMPSYETAAYTYDALGSLTLLKAGTAHYRYERDLAGRLTAVDRWDTGFAATATPEAYYRYTYLDGLPSSMYEGEAVPASEAVRWTYDDLGRIITKEIRRPVEVAGVHPGWDAYDTLWDYDPATETTWVGAPIRAESPIEVTAWEFVEGTPPPGGFVGAPTSKTRTYPGLLVDPLRFDYVYDGLGRLVATTWPSGTHVETTYSGGLVASTEVSAGSNTQVTVEPSYGGVWGDVDEVAVTDATGADYTVTYAYDRPARASGYSWAVDDSSPSDAHGLAFTFAADGRLLAKQYSSTDAVALSGLGMDRIEYVYDGLGRIAAVDTRADGGTAELNSRYEYADQFGNLARGEQRILTPEGPLPLPPMDYVSDTLGSVHGPFHSRMHRMLWIDPQDTAAGTIVADVVQRDPVTSRITKRAFTFVESPPSGPGDPGVSSTDHWEYQYDGTGQLVGIAGDVLAAGEVFDPEDPMYEKKYFHTADDVQAAGVVADGAFASSPISPRWEFTFDGWKLDLASTDSGLLERHLEQVLPSLILVHDPQTLTVSPQWLLRERDGHVWAQLDDTGTLTSAQPLGAFGLPVGTYAATGTSPRAPAFFDDLRDQFGLHGVDLDEHGGGFRMGVRTVLDSGDGTWLQPEPLLHLGLEPEQLLVPRGFFGPYALGSTTTHSDLSGYEQERVSGVIGSILSGTLWTCATDSCENGDVNENTATDTNSKVSELLSNVVEIVEAIDVVNAILATYSKANEVATNASKSLGAWVRAGVCFTADTEVCGPDGYQAIEGMAPGALVLAARLSESERSPSVGVSLVEASAHRSLVNRICGRLRQARWSLALPLTLLSACDVRPPPGPAETVAVFDAVSGTWGSELAGSVPPGGEFLHGGHLYRADTGTTLDLGTVDPLALADADAAVTEVKQVSEPNGTSWVRVLADGDSAGRHARLGDVVPGERFAFQGRVYASFGGARVEEVQETGEVLGRVVNTFARTADAVIDLDVAYPDGSRDTLTGTPEHPFWVPSERDYVALMDLAVGTVLRTYGGSEATVLGLTLRKGDVEVYDIEVEGLHNFFVRGPGGEAAGVLVHNSTPKRLFPGVVVDSTQFGHKVGKHAVDFGLDPGDPTARAWIRGRIDTVVQQYDEVRQGPWNPDGGGGTDFLFYRQGADVVVTKPTGDFVTILAGGQSNGWFNSAGRIATSAR